MDSFQQLEFDKLREILARYCHSLVTKDRARNIVPLKDATSINDRGILISECQELLKQGIDFNFREIEDIRKLLYDFEFQAYSFIEFSKIFPVAETSVTITDALAKNQQIFDYTEKINFLISDITPFPHICKRYREIFSHEGEVLDTASPQLKEIRRRQGSIRKNIFDTLGNRLQDKRYENIIQDKIITQREGRYVIPLREGTQSAMPGIVHGYSGSKASIYVEPSDIVVKNNELNSLRQEEKEEIYRIFTDFTTLIRNDKESLDKTCKILLELDFLFGAARFANAFSAVKPVISDKSVVKLVNARHPLLMEKFDSIDEVIPFDLSLGEINRFFILSGPNTGGKTVTLKATGLLTLMALSGLPIPAAESSEIGLFDTVFADIGDDQSLENSLSTFSAHIERIKEMLAKGRDRTLVLIDEIGAATDPEQGSVLAQAIIEELLRRRVLGIVTTHFTNLKLYAEQSDECVNAAMQFDVGKHIPTYRFKTGLPGNSFAIEIAERLGLDSSIIARAKNLAGKENVELTELISKISQEKIELAQAKYQFQLKSKLLEMKVSEYEKILTLIEQDKKDIRKASIKKAQDFLTDIQREVNQEIEVLRKAESDKKKKAASQVLAKTGVKMSELISQEEEYKDYSELVPLINPKPGDTVWVKEFDDNGEIVSLEKGNAKIIINGLYFTTGASKLFQAKKLKKTAKAAVMQRESKEIKTELKLLGMTFDETKPLIGAFLDEGYNAGLTRLRIVHGKGTGILRSKIRQYLKNIPIVEEFFTPAPEAGGDGVTVVVFHSQQ